MQLACSLQVESESSIDAAKVMGDNSYFFNIQFLISFFGLLVSKCF